MGAITPPYRPRYGAGVPAGSAPIGQIYFQTDAKYAMWTFNAGQWNRTTPLILGAGVPTFIAEAGILYSRTDAAELYSSQPTLAPAVVVQSAHSNGHSTSGGIVFGAPVTAGNLLLASWCTSTDQSNNVNSPAWNVLDANNSGSSGAHSAVIGYRYAAGGDGTTPPDFFTGAGNPFWGLQVLEISGVTGNIGADIASHTMSFGDFFVGDFTTPNAVTTNANELAIIMASAYNGTATWANPAGYTVVDNYLDTSNSGALLATKQQPASGTNIGNKTMAKPPGTNSGFYGEQIIFNAGLTANWTKISA